MQTVTRLDKVVDKRAAYRPMVDATWNVKTCQYCGASDVHIDAFTGKCAECAS